MSSQQNPSAFSEIRSPSIDDSGAVPVTSMPSIPIVAASPSGRSLAGRLPAEMLMWLLTLTLALAPLPLASARPLPWSILAVVLGSLLVLATLCEAIDSTPSGAMAPLRVPVVLFFLIAIWIWIQSLRFPDAAEFSAAWRMAAQALGGVLHPAISLDHEDSISHLLRLLTYGAAFLLAWRIGRVSENANWIVKAVGTIGLVYAVYGLIVYFSGSRTVLWYSKWAYQGDLTGTFVNRNSFATFLGLSITANLAWLAQILVRNVDNRSWRAHIESVADSLFRHGLLPTLSLVIQGSALLFTHSRGGTVSALLGMGALTICAVSAPSLRAPWRTAFVTLAALGAILVIILNGGTLLRRVSDTAVETDLRVNINEGTLRAIGNDFLLGTGLGTFKYVYAPYQPPTEGKFIERAHNDYLENVLELGIPAGMTFFVMLALLVFECLRGVVRRRRNAIFPCLGFGASVLVGFHSAVDFSMQVPAVAITYAALLGVGVAQSRSSVERSATARPSPKPA